MKPLCGFIQRDQVFFFSSLHDNKKYSIHSLIDIFPQSYMQTPDGWQLTTYSVELVHLVPDGNLVEIVYSFVWSTVHGSVSVSAVL